MTFREESGQTKSVTLVRALPSSFDHFPRYSSVASVPVVPAASCSRSGAPLDGSTPLASDSAVWCPAQVRSLGEARGNEEAHVPAMDE